MKIKETPIAEIVPFAGNPRKKAAVAKVMASIEEFGWRQPIVVDSEMVVVVGHPRLVAVYPRPDGKETSGSQRVPEWPGETGLVGATGMVELNSGPRSAHPARSSSEVSPSLST